MKKIESMSKVPENKRENESDNKGFFALLVIYLKDILKKTLLLIKELKINYKNKI